MPKQKSRKSISKRFRLTGTGKVMRRVATGRHLKANKPKSRTRKQKIPVQVPEAYAKKLRKILI